MNNGIPASIAAERDRFRLTLERANARRAVFSACVQGSGEA